MYRRNLRHSRIKNIFKFVSSKMNKVLTVESRLEFDTCFHLEYSPDISFIEAQPEGFIYPFQDKHLPYTPDFLIVDKGERKLIEVKPFKKTQSPEFQQRFSAKKAQAENFDIPLILVTEKQIRVNPILNNLKLLHRYSGFQSFTPLHLSFLKLVKRYKQIKVKDFITSCHVEQNVAVKTALALISSGMLHTNLSAQEISLDSIVWCSGHEKL